MDGRGASLPHDHAAVTTERRILHSSIDDNGKVERPIRYIRESFFYGRTFANDDDLNEQASRWLEGTANLRRHATTGERPVDRFERDERSALLPLANCPYRRLGLSQAPEPEAAAPSGNRGGRAATAHGLCGGTAMKAPAPARRDRLREMLADLKMPGALEAVDGILSEADSGTLSAAEAIEQLLNAQILLRNNRRLQTAMRASRLPAVKTLDQFDFAFQPSIKREQIESLHELGFLDRGENVIYLGPPGVGKTHLAISLAIAAAQSGRRVYYGTLAGLIESLTEAKAAGNLSRRLRVLTHPALLVVDEIGYLPVNQDGAVLFFQLINARHERASTVLTSNKGFEDWGGVLGDEVMAAALIDRLVHHCHIVNIRGNSYRMRGPSEPSAGRLGSAPQEGCVVTAGQNGSSNGGARPLWVAGLSPPDSWRSLRQPGNPQLHQVRHPQHRVWGHESKPEVSNFRLAKVSNFRLGLTASCLPI